METLLFLLFGPSILTQSFAGGSGLVDGQAALTLCLPLFDSRITTKTFCLHRLSDYSKSRQQSISHLPSSGNGETCRCRPGAQSWRVQLQQRSTATAMGQLSSETECPSNRAPSLQQESAAGRFRERFGPRSHRLQSSWVAGQHTVSVSFR